MEKYPDEKDEELELIIHTSDMVPIPESESILRKILPTLESL